MRRRVDEWAQEVKRLEERARLYEDRIMLIERERLPQMETTVRNMNVFLDLQRDIVARMKETETSTLATLEQATKKLEEFCAVAKETSRKLITRVACDTYDYEMAYIKNIIKGFKMNMEDVTRTQTGFQRILEQTFKAGGTHAKTSEDAESVPEISQISKPEEEAKVSTGEGQLPLSSEFIQQVKDLIEEK
jgi:hypothetical protein